MLALGIRYLNGFAAACEPDARIPGRERAEWPPHPVRVFMALAAAHFETEGQGGPGEREAERQALLWLESLPPPHMRAAGCSARAVVTHYVPVNDKAGEEAKPPTAPIQSLPQLTRERQPRTFARAWLDDDTVYLIWPDATPAPALRQGLASLCGNVTRIGHSMSLVQMWVAEPEEIGPPNWVPDDERAVVHLRVPGPGTLAYLEQQYNAAAVEDYGNLKVAEWQAGDPESEKAARRRLREAYANQPPTQQRPRLSLYHGYARPAQASAVAGAAGTVFSPHFPVLQLRAKQGPYQQLDLTSTLAVANRWREAILSHSNGLSASVRRMLSGHDANGGPADAPHLAFLPLAFVGHEHAGGHLLGMGLVLPAGLSREERREMLRAIAAVRELRLGPLGLWSAEPVTASQPPWNLRAEAWTAYPKGATHWSTVTPIVFDHHPKARDRARFQEETAAMIAAACTRIGLPAPREVIVTHVSAHPGVPPAFAFPLLRRKDGSERRHAHAILVFDEPVVGPVLVGAGRYRGYGACRPI